ncbi:Gfo/Idh/MocA family protein [Membranihabitans maritimus]|uniref:Gfo/Idh/MocA family protein n=1 Tax=Membranihabitans maritimus TaxID=2904244 RepID=UPI001F2F4BD9|nr:Gfo/Idh/MocA family oxidoreductase [Membranihabitans maritimus]
MSGYDRRGFIKKSGLITGGVAVSPFPGILRFGSQTTNSLKIGLVGCGGRGTGAAAQALMAHPGNTLVAMGDLFEDHLSRSFEGLMEVEEIQKQLQVSNENKFLGFDAYKNVIEKCDVVILATPPAFRPEHFELAVDQGKHVFMEKPLSCDGPGTRRILDAGKVADEKNLKVVVGLQNRYDPAYQEMVQQLQDGVIGKIVSSTCYYLKGGYPLIPRSTVSSELEFQIKNWHYFTWVWAGAPAGLQIHNADIVHWAKGNYPVKAQGMGGRASLKGPDSGDVFDHFYIEYTYDDGTTMHSEIRNIDKNFNKNGTWFIGTEGTANVREGIQSHTGKALWSFDPSKGNNAYQLEHDVFFDAIIHDKPQNDTRFGAYSTLTANMGRMAAHSGREISQEMALKSDLKLYQEITSWDDIPPVLPDQKGIYPFPTPGITSVY